LRDNEKQATTLNEYVKNPDNKESLEQFLTSGKIGVRIISANAEDKYFAFDNGTLWMESKPGYWGSYLSYFNGDYLDKLLTLDHSGKTFALVAKRNLNDHLPKIEAKCAEITKSFGKPVSWEDNFADIYTALEKHSKGRGDDIGAKALEYANQAATTLGAFVKNEDNKEALEELWSTGKIGIQILDANGSDKYWEIKDGILWMGTKPGYWGSYLSYFNEEYLEKLF